MLSKPIRQLLYKFFKIFWRDEQFANPLGEPIWVFGDHEQTLLDIARAGEDISIQAWLIVTLLDTADLLEGEEQTIVEMTGNETDGDPCGSDDVGRCRAEELRVPIKKRKSQN